MPPPQTEAPMPPAAADPLRAYLESLPEWADQRRVDSLFSNLGRLQAANPVAYDRNVSFWKSLILTAADEGWSLESPARDGRGASLLVVTEESLAARFQRKGAAPVGLGAVLADMASSGEVAPLSTFTGRAPAGGSRGVWSASQSAAAWVFKSLVWAPLAWTFALVVPIDFESRKAAGSAGAGRNEAVVLVPALRVGEEGRRDERSHARLWSSRQLDFHYASVAHPITDNMMPVAELLSSMRLEPQGRQAIPLSEVDKNVVLQHWILSGTVVVEDVGEHGLGSVRNLRPSTGPIAKFRDNDRDGKRPLVLTKTDKGIAQIKRTRYLVAKQIEDLDLLAKARADVTVPHKKALALSSLRRKRLLSDVLLKRIGSLETLENVLLKIQTAATDGEVGIGVDLRTLQAYNVAADTLQSVLQSSGLDVGTVDAVLEKLSEAMADQREIEDAVHAGGEELRTAAGVEVDAAELDAELDELLRLDEEEKAKEREAAEAEKEKGRRPPLEGRGFAEPRAGVIADRIASEATVSGRDGPPVPTPLSKALPADDELAKGDAAKAKKAAWTAFFNFPNPPHVIGTRQQGGVGGIVVGGQAGVGRPARAAAAQEVSGIGAVGGGGDEEEEFRAAGRPAVVVAAAQADEATAGTRVGAACAVVLVPAPAGAAAGEVETEESEGDVARRLPAEPRAVGDEDDGGEDDSGGGNPETPQAEAAARRPAGAESPTPAPPQAHRFAGLRGSGRLAAAAAAAAAAGSSAEILTSSTTDVPAAAGRGAWTSEVDAQGSPAAAGPAAGPALLTAGFALLRVGSAALTAGSFTSTAGSVALTAAGAPSADSLAGRADDRAAGDARTEPGGEPERPRERRSMIPMPIRRPERTGPPPKRDAEAAEEAEAQLPPAPAAADAPQESRG
ncbi:MAG: hypothetical protein BJ554DRAFT_2492, partial [Olpidium bornovanus]